MPGKPPALLVQNVEGLDRSRSIWPLINLETDNGGESPIHGVPGPGKTAEGRKDQNDQNDHLCPLRSTLCKRTKNRHLRQECAKVVILARILT